jgi:hypothetical protein
MMSTLSPARLVYRQGDALPALRLTPGSGTCAEVFDATAYDGWLVTIAGPVTTVIPGELVNGEVVAELDADTLAVAGDYLITVAAEDEDGNARTWPSDGGTELHVAPVLT